MPDRAVLKVGNQVKPLSIAEFMEIAIDRQVELLFRGEVTFFSGTTPVRTLDALKAIREKQARSPTRA